MFSQSMEINKITLFWDSMGREDRAGGDRREDYSTVK